ncbi:putative ABC transporter permease [Butyrivibrio sp. NC3005]|uniref:putative ABC transporter permease n=1 Tax=Butyrivibrio sp. NC3005 TaxID=1280685 RepID=UPI00047897FA|nr:putative ABC transporter permease [Butyrivibrio sp. NC3005]
MYISKLFCQFIFFSFLGWIWESFYCAMKEKKWVDRGFMFGPVCPIYGSSMCIVLLVIQLFPNFLNPDRPAYVLFLFSMIGSAVMEYTTSVVLETRFGARWWDYGDIPLNLNGRICLPASLGFGAAGVIVIKFLIPFFSGIQLNIPNWVFETASIPLAALFGADLALTVASLSTLINTVEAYKNEFNLRAEVTVNAIASTPKRVEAAFINKKDQIKEQFPQIGKYVKFMSPFQKRVMRNVKIFIPKSDGKRASIMMRMKNYIENYKENSQS